MKKALTVFILIIAIMTTGCTKKTDVDAPTDGAAGVQPSGSTSEPTTDNPREHWEDELYYNNGTIVTPWADSALKENLKGDITLSAKEDFHLYVNYDWLKNTEIPAGYSSFSYIDEINNQVIENALTLLSDESIKGHDVKLVRDLYSAILDWDERNKRGIEPLLKMIEEIESVKTLDELTDLICDSDKERVLPRFVDISVQPALTDSSKYVASVSVMEHKSPTTLRFNNDFIATEKQFFAKMMERAGYSQIEAAQMYDAAINYIDAILQWSMNNTQGDSQSADYREKNTIIVSKEEVQNLTDNFPLMRILESQGFGNVVEYQIFYPDAFKMLDKLYTAENLKNLKKSMIVNGVMAMAPFLDQETIGYINDYINKVSGTKDSISDEVNALLIVKSYLDVPLSNVYLQRYEVAELKERITQLIRQILDEYRVMIKEEVWLSEEMRTYAIEKLNALKILAVCPDEAEDLSALDLDGLSYFDAINRLSDFYKEKHISQIGRPVNDYAWQGSVLDVNAYYFPQNNSICIPLGILTDKLYYDGISDEELYAGIGTIIGHELSHAFDTKGALYDKNGDYKDWWVQEDYSAFQKRADRLVKYFNHMTGFWGGAVNGPLVSGEAIADIAGMKVILQLAEKKENFDYEKFFTAYAKHWRMISTAEYEKYLLMSDTHLLKYLRTNAVLQQFDIFFETFDIHEGDNMYLAPKSRVSVW